MKGSRTSAGIVLYRKAPGGLEVLLAHPGGPFWANKDEGAWTIPKGEIGEGEEEIVAARREFEEETGFCPDGPFLDLGEVRQRAGKRVRAWAAEGDADPAACRSNPVTVEWPRGSGKQLTFPEVDRCEWFQPGEAKQRINTAQAVFIDRLEKELANGSR
jgi:predicted NUDIX family NTP pyrophosphohydrolase